MEKLLILFEKYISYILMVIAMIFVCYQVVDVVIQFTNRLIADAQNHTIVIEEKGKPVAGIFFSILLTLEIIQTIRVFAHDHSDKVKIILIVGLIAVTRKILLEDMASEANTKEEFAIAALIIALSAGYYLVSRADTKSPD